MRDLPLQADKSHLSRCQRCVWSARTVLATVATSDAYAALAVEMARSAAAVGVASCACVVVSDAVRAIGDAAVEQVVLPWSSTWRPPTSWCTHGLSQITIFLPPKRASSVRPCRTRSPMQTRLVKKQY